MKKATIKDIARELDISVGTVYRALNNKGRIKGQTKQKVIDKARELNYTTNTIARRFAMRSNYCILIVMPEGPDFFWNDVRTGLTSIERELAEFGTEIKTFYVKPGYNPDVHLEIIKILDEKEINGLAIVPLHIYKFDQLLEYTKEHSIPTAVFSTAVDNNEMLFYYGPDDKLSGLMAGELLSKFINLRGDVCVMVRKEDFIYNSQRLQGFCKYIQKNAPLINIFDIYTYEDDHEYEVLDKALSNPQMKGLYVMDGGGAGIFGKLLKEKNIVDMPLVGHENFPLSKAMLMEGYVTVLLCEERFCQGYYPVKILYEYLVQGILPAEKDIYTNINVVLKENIHYLDYYKDGRGYR